MTTTARSLRVGTLLLLVGMIAPDGGAQPGKPSQHATLTQTIGPLDVRLAYNRPVARGRRLFGGLVPFGTVWNPGADTATSISFTRDVLVAGQRLVAGHYSLWAVPDSVAWTIIFSRADPVFHVPYPAGRDALRVRARPLAAPHMETLAFYFPLVDGDSATLVLHWGRTVVPLQIRVR